MQKSIKNRLWEAADNLRANSELKSSEYSTPVLGLIFLRYAYAKLKKAEEQLKIESGNNLFNNISPTDYRVRGVLYLPPKARYNYLVNLSKNSNLGQAINYAMELIEKENKNLAGVLPKNYQIFEDDMLMSLIHNFANIPINIEGDAFGKIYEYFLGKFAMKEGQKGGEFFTPTSIVKLIVEILEPFHGKIYDPASGSGGMFVQSAKFIAEHKKSNGKNLSLHKISIHGQEKQTEIIKLCKMNLAVHGLEGNIKQGNTFYNDLHNSIGKFDFVMANPPFNVSGVDKKKIKTDKRFSLGMHRTNNANYLWIQIFLNALNKKGRAGFVMSNSANDSRNSELEIRKQLIIENYIDIMIAVSSNFFYTVTLPCTLWFIDKHKKNTNREGKILFIDARNIYKQIDRAHREFIDSQIDYIAYIVKLYRNEKIEKGFVEKTKKTIETNLKYIYKFEKKGRLKKEENQELQNLKCNLEIMETLIKEWKKNFPENKFVNIPGLCKIATLEEIKKQGYSLNPGRYVKIAEKQEDDFDFYKKLDGLNNEFKTLNSKARELEKKIADNILEVLKQSI